MLKKLGSPPEMIEENLDNIEKLSQSDARYWDYNKPDEISISKWRRDQVKKFLDNSSNCKGKDVKL